MLSILCVILTIKVKVGIPESFKVGWYPLEKTGSSHLKTDTKHCCTHTLSKWFDHITPILFKLHWLPLNYRIHFKILLFVYKCLNGLSPTYLSELLRSTNGPRLLRSSSQSFLAVPRTSLKTHGDRAFSAAAPRL